jgi:hypothetical protein
MCNNELFKQTIGSLNIRAATNQPNLTWVSMKIESPFGHSVIYKIRRNGEGDGGTSKGGFIEAWQTKVAYWGGVSFLV